jgi:NAD(P)-dependent dehydrogenase (short-subunit alcohol dehydrogenase family)
MEKVDFSLAGKIALITGSSRGIGEATAVTLASNGAHCILVSRNIDALEAVAKNIKNQGGKAEAIACDTGDMNQIKDLFETIQESHGKLDILINNAGASPHEDDMFTANESHWDQTMDINLKGPFFMTLHSIPLMKKAGGGTIINVASVCAITPYEKLGIYSISKAGMVSMTKGFAKELALDNIRVNALLPGSTATQFLGEMGDDPALINAIPMKRTAHPMEMAGAMLYLASKASSYVTGACIICDGGLTV